MAESSSRRVVSRLQSAGHCPLTGALVATRAACLAEGLWRSMLPARWACAVGFLGAAVFAVSAGVMVGQRALSASPPPTATALVISAPMALPQQARDRYGDPLPPGALARIGTIRLRFGGWDPADLAFLPDSKRVVTVNHQQAVRLWDLASGQEIRRFREADKDNYPRGAAISPDGTVLAFGGFHTIRLWNVGTGQEIHHWRGGNVRSLVFTPDGQTLISGGAENDALIRFWNVATGKERRRMFWEQRAVDYLAITPDGRTLLSASRNYPDIRFIDLTTNQELAHISNRRWRDLTACCLSRDGKRLAISGTSIGKVENNRVHMEAVLRIVEVPSGKVLRDFAGPRGRVVAAALSPDGHLLAATDLSNELFFWNADTGQEIRRIQHAPADMQLPSLQTLCFCPDGRTLVGATGSAMRLWDVATGQELHRSDGHLGTIKASALSPDGSQLATGSFSDSTMLLWDVGSGKLLHTLAANASYIRALSYLPDGKHLVSSGGDSNIYLWDPATGQKVRTFTLPGRQQVETMNRSADGQVVMVSSMDFNLRHGQSQPVHFTAWNVQSGKQLYAFDDSTPLFSFPGLSPDGKTIAMAKQKGVALVDGTNQHVLLTLKTSAGTLDYPFAFSSDGKLLAVRRKNIRREGNRISQEADKILVFDVGIGKELRSFPSTGLWEPLVFSPDSKLLASANEENAFSLWEVATGKEIYHSEDLDAAISSIAFSGDGRTLATGLANTTTLIWRVPQVP